MTRPTAPISGPARCEFEGTKRYVVRRRLGQGAMGIVYEAFDRERKARVALKLLRRADPAEIYRFKREFRALADVSHRNLVDLHELVSVGSEWFFTMELVDGGNFLDHLRAAWTAPLAPPLGEADGGSTATATASAAAIATSAVTASATADTAASTGEDGVDEGDARAARREAPVGPCVAALPSAAEHFAAVRSCTRQLVAGVQALHEAGHLHRDIKPSNILVDRHGRIVLVDFGVAFQLSGGDSGGRDAATAGRDDAIAGTPVYMAPEQMNGDALGEAADWYAVGVVLFEALTGRRPFYDSTRGIRLAKSSCNGPSPGAYCPGLPDDLDQLCSDLLARDPAQRPTGEQVLARLGHADDGSDEDDSIKARSSVSEVTLVGREQYLDRIYEQFESTREGRSCTLLISGPSGVGKSVLMHHAVSQLEERHGAIVLEGRCYERESVPYKALDHLVDELCQYLLARPDGDLAALLPEGFDALAQLFPVLRRLVGKTGSAAAHPDLYEQRLRAFRALRNLLAALARESALVLCIDDAQWGDVDSAMALAEVLRGDNAPAILVLVTCRSEEAAASAFLSALTPELPELARLEVAPMSREESRRLAHSLLERSGVVADDTLIEEANTIAEEAGGNPLFVVELARSTLAGGARRRSREHDLSLDQVIRDRVDELSKPARLLLRVVAVAARPMAQGPTRAAADLGDDGRRALAELRTGRLVRSTGARDQDHVAVYHDRIRTAVLGALTSDELVDTHRRLAEVLEAGRAADPEILALHFEGAGDAAHAGHYAALAAANASAALAFDRAAAHYQRALELSVLTAESESELRARFADALACAGRGAAAGRTYLSAINGASPARALALRRKAAGQLLTSGHIEEGRAALKAALSAVDARFPTTTSLLSLLRLGLSRLWLRLRGSGFRERDAIAPEQIDKLDIYWSAVTGFGYCDLVLAADFLTRFQLLAYRTGELHRVVCGLASELVYTGGAGYRARKRSARILDRTFTLATRCRDPHARGLALACAAYRAYPLGEFAEALDYATRADKVLRERCTGVTWELGLSQMVRMWSLYYMGRTRELAQRLPVLLRDARERNDWFMATNLCTTVLNVRWLLADDVDEARIVCGEAMSRWPTDMGVLLQHFWEVMALGQAALYAGEGRKCWELVRERWPALRWSPVMQLQIARIEFLDLHARAALAAAQETPAGSERRRLLRVAARGAGKIARRKSTITAPMAALVRAGAAACAGRKQRAIESLVIAEGGFDRASMALHAACARYRRGQLLGGELGKEMIAEARQLCESESIVNPARMVAMHAPGFAEDD